ncbi:cyclic nucleotide-binding protein [Scytonema hofmannii PCC 7110]|uniref:Cyclic nucleotide-binding protein n=1 Tax=Scytonema hofmannii PCC 7110 TaxID=128403 RepID=A0A139X931_9CYAN|nr:tetratricopeptide repeat protein [Scytonema hofmannii]KYC41186.1 cyclic nucleotide-binding protein [Scytonema hofmannii PCC 7110]
MLEQIASALERKDYPTAAKLLKQLLKESPDNPWVQFYLGRLYESTGKQTEAEKVYRRLLRDTTNSKLLTQARQGLQRLEDIEKEERQQAKARATSDASNTELGVLVLEPIGNELKTQAAQKFAQIMQLDAYNARLMLPSRGWRVYRTGAVGELKYYGEQLRNANIPCFWTTLSEIQKIKVFQVSYFQQSTSGVTVVCKNDSNQLGSLNFEWSEVRGRVQGLLPIFEQVVDRNVRGKLERKTQTQDYFQFYDLHLPGRSSILRLHDNGYDFQQGIEIAVAKRKPYPAYRTSHSTIRMNWNSLLSWIDQKLLQVEVWSEFTHFAQTALDRTELLHQIQSHIHLFRREPTDWDSAFHLYSSLVFLQNVRSHL